MTRGYSFAAILADEVAFWRSDDGSANPDVETLRALAARPCLDYRGAMLLLASLLYAKRGELYNLYRRYHGKGSGPRIVLAGGHCSDEPLYLRPISLQEG